MNTFFQKNKNFIILILSCLMVVCFLISFTFMPKTASAVDSQDRSDLQEYMNKEMDELEYNISHISVDTENSATFNFEINLKRGSFREYFDIFNETKDSLKRAHFGQCSNYAYNEWSLALVNIDLLKGMVPSGYNIQVKNSFWLNEGLPANSDYLLSINDETIRPDYIFYNADFLNLEVDEYFENISFGVTIKPSDRNTTFVPILVFHTFFDAYGWFNGCYCHFNGNNIYPARDNKSIGFGLCGMERSGIINLATMSYHMLNNGHATNPVLRENIENNSFITDRITVTENTLALLEKYPLDLKLVAGATSSEENTITWQCSFIATSFTQLKNICANISVNWFVIKNDSTYQELGKFENVQDYLNYNEKYSLKHIRGLKSFNAITDSDNNFKYISSCTFNVNANNLDTQYIAIPYIEIADGTDSGGYLSKVYVTCDLYDTARSVNELISEESKTYEYIFSYLVDLENKPFAKYTEERVTVNNRINWNTATNNEIDAFLSINTNDDGDFICLMSKLTYWYVYQDLNNTNTYFVRACYSTIPLQMEDDNGNIDVLKLGLTSFSDIDGKNEYLTSLISLKDKKGNSYFKNEYEIEPNNLYGYFYAYSYESEYDCPNWQLSDKSYRGSIVYFTELTNVNYKVGVNDFSTIGSFAGVLVGSIAGELTGNVVGGVVGGVIGGVVGTVGGNILGRLLGYEEVGSNTYYYCEYGFLDCTDDLPGNYYKKNNEEPIPTIYILLLLLIICFELVIFLKYLLPFINTMPLAIKIVLIVGTVVLLVLLDISFLNLLRFGAFEVII